VTTTVRILAIIYIAQAAAGIALGIVYAVWTMSRV
jgi:multidrug transporter EmrE-like cation transporter